MIFLVTLWYRSWWCNKLTCIKLWHHILKTIGVDIGWRVILLCLPIAVIGTCQSWSGQVHAQVVIVIWALSCSRHYEIIQLILIVCALHRIDGRWWCLVPRWTLFSPLFNDLIDVIVMIVLANFRLWAVPLYFEFFRILLRMTIRVHFFEFNQTLILSWGIEIIALLL